MVMINKNPVYLPQKICEVQIQILSNIFFYSNKSYTFLLARSDLLWFMVVSFLQEETPISLAKEEKIYLLNTYYMRGSQYSDMISEERTKSLSPRIPRTCTQKT